MKTSRRGILLSGVAAAAVASATVPASGMFWRGSANPSPGTTITTETIANFSASSTPGFFRFGMMFKKGDCPSGHIPLLSRTGGVIIDAQFDERVTWSDGSLKFCVANCRDTTFGGSESRVYSVSAIIGVFDNTGSTALSDITGAHDFKVAFTSVAQYNGSTTATRGSGAFTASFNTHAAVATRVTKYHSGPVCESWEVWGMARDNTGGAADAHLKTNWYVTIWKNDDGSIADFEYGAVVAQDWWSTGSKFRLDYTAALKNGSTTKYTYSAVQHPYQAQWMTVRTDNDDNHARRPWVTEIPTLCRKMNKAYAITTGLLPPLDTTFTPNSNASIGYTSSYTPLGRQNHRAEIDATGGYPGRGIITNMDAVAFMRQTSNDYRYARTNAFAGLHIPYHHRSNDNRTRPGESADVANTVISLIMRPLLDGSDDFTGDGMPAKIDAYVGSTSPPISATYAPKTGGNGVWSISSDTSHAVPYSYFLYLLEGERHFMQATLDLATNAAHRQGATGFGAAPNFLYYQFAPYQTLYTIPNTLYSGILTRPAGANSRNVGWALILVSHAAAVVPDADVQAGFIKLYQARQAIYMVQNIPYVPAQQLALGFWGTLSGGHFSDSPWMSGFECMGCALCVTACEDANALTFLNACLQYNPIGAWQVDTQYRSLTYRALLSPNSFATYNPSTSPLFDLDDVCMLVDCTASAGVITLFSGSQLPPTNGDVFYPAAVDTNTNSVGIMSGLSAGVVYYAVNVSGTSFSLATSPGGSPVAVSGGGSLGWRPQVWTAYSIGQYPPHLPNADDSPSISFTALAMAKLAGASGVTPTMMNRAQTFLQNVDFSGWVTWKVAA